MDGRIELITALQAWAAKNKVTLRWDGSVLRIEDPEGRANAVVDFPDGYWDAFNKASPDRRDVAMMAMVSDVQLLWPEK